VNGFGGGTVELAWGLRQSFVAYVEGLPDGLVRATGGAVRADDVFVFPGRRESANAWAFDGALHFRGHAGVLDVTFAAIRIDAGGLSAEVAGERIPIARLADRAELARPGGAPSTRFGAVTLTDDGAAVLGGVYQTDTPADPVTIRAVIDPADLILASPAHSF
jgi:hypothetical protein